MLILDVCLISVGLSKSVMQVEFITIWVFNCCSNIFLQLLIFMFKGPQTLWFIGIGEWLINERGYIEKLKALYEIEAVPEWLCRTHQCIERDACYTAAASCSQSHHKYQLFPGKRLKNVKTIRAGGFPAHWEKCGVFSCNLAFHFNVSGCLFLEYYNYEKKGKVIGRVCTGT